MQAGFFLVEVVIRYKNLAHAKQLLIFPTSGG